MDVIYCAAGNTRLATIAIEEGFLYGGRSDDIRRKLRCDGLIDINWKNYDWDRHVKLVKEHRPKYAVVPDITRVRQLDITLELAQELAQYCEHIIVVPKVPDVIGYIPKQYIIGVSIPTSYAGFVPNMSELTYRTVHLLGGTPRQQRDYWKHYQQTNIVVTSVDTNSHSKASDFGSYWDGTKWCDAERKGIGKYGAFRKSCQGIMRMWARLGAIVERVHI